MGIAMKMLSSPEMYIKNIHLITWDKGERTNGLGMHVAFQTTPGPSYYHFLLNLYSRLCAAELQHTCFFCRTLHVDGAQNQSHAWNLRWGVLPLPRIHCSYCTELWGSAALNGSLLWSWLIARAGASDNSGNLKGNITGIPRAIHL